MTHIHRRDFIKLSGAALISVSLGLQRRRIDATTHWETQAPPAPLGRVASAWRLAMRTAPTQEASLVAWKTRDDIMPLEAMVKGEAPWPSNPYWFKTPEGYIHTGYVQPVRDAPSEKIITRVEGRGFWAEVCVPYIISRWSPSPEGRASTRLYYSTVYRVIDARRGDDGEWWYRLQDGVTWSPGPYVPARNLSPFSAQDLAPIKQVPPHPLWKSLPPEDRAALPARDPGKWIELNLQTQMLRCFEGPLEVFAALTATGSSRTPTPRGSYRILYKRHAQRMIGPGYDLPGVPFPIYITTTGIALHGTYWHHDYGRPQSHGCINVLSDEARWIFRWVDPVVRDEENLQVARPGEGTPMYVI